MFCSQCGIKLDSNARFCPNCGSKINIGDNTSENMLSSTDINKEYIKADHSINENADLSIDDMSSEEKKNTLLQKQKTNDEFKNIQMTNHQKKKIEIQSTIKMIYSLVALMFIVCGLLFPFYSTKHDEKWKFAKMEDKVKQIKSSINTLDYINELFDAKIGGEEQQIYEDSKEAYTMMIILKVIAIVSIVLLLINCFIPVKVGLLGLGFGGIIINLLSFSKLNDLWKELSGPINLEVGAYVLMIGFFLEVMADPGPFSFFKKKD